MKKHVFGRLDGRSVDQIVLESADAAVSILSYGCTVRDWRVEADGRTLPVVLGFRDMEAYRDHARAHGIIAGRVANRTAEGCFTLDGRTVQLTRNEGPHHLHGGSVGLGRRIWEMEGDSAANAVILRYASPDGEEGYPGAVDFSVTYRLEGARLECEMTGVPDRPTPINLAQHSYYNLGRGGDVRDHVLCVAASAYTPLGKDLLPEGTIRSVEGTRYDFTAPRSLVEADPEGVGLDVNMVLDEGREGEKPAAWASSPRTGLRLRLWTREPGLQVFDANRPPIAVPGHEGEIYRAFSGLCLEAQHFPDSLHHPDWPSILRTAEAPYHQRLSVEIAPE